MSTIFLIRHGQASFGKGDYDKLSERGIEQSRMCADYLIRSGISFDVVYAGTMVRHLETADEYYSALREKGLPEPDMIRTEGLNEYDSKAILTALVPELLKDDGSWSEHLSRFYSDRRSFQLVFEAVMDKWISGDYKATGFQSWDEFCAGVDRSIDEIMTSHGRGRTIAVFTSGGTIASFVKRALNLSGRDTMRITWQIVNASLSRFKCTEREVMMATFNEYGHLDRDMVTYR